MQILYTDKDIIACIKPVGMDAEHQMPKALQEQVGGEVFTLHRLDLNVGGVMLYARNKQAAAVLSKSIQEGTMIKEYVAMVHGIVPESGDWEDFLWKDSRKNKVFVVKRMRGGVKKARLEFKRFAIKQDENEADACSFVRIRLHTGRSHQIRVQFASRKYPLVGDHKYGARDHVAEPMLFSCKITVPYQKRRLEFEAFPEWMPAHETVLNDSM